ncbi:MAG: hypothetical protein LBT18_02455, partial [Endomicrobium sp.]|nr:hypothetical protein [Endomicrobium sp.]
MSHKLVKSLLVSKVVGLIMQEYKVSQDKALDMFYTSSVATYLNDDETGLYGQSALYIFSVFSEELKLANRQN